MDWAEEKAKEIGVKMASAAIERREPLTNMTDILVTALRETDQRARDEERVACAKIADQWSGRDDRNRQGLYRGSNGTYYVKEEIVDAIRARAGKGGE